MHGGKVSIFLFMKINKVLLRVLGIYYEGFTNLTISNKQKYTQANVLKP